MQMKDTAKLDDKGVKVTVYLEPKAWKLFQLGCMERDVTPSSMIRGFIANQLEDWKLKAIMDGICLKKEKSQ